MSGIRVLCDTNPLIYLLGGNKELAGFLNNKQIHVSVITELELFSKPELSETDREIIETMLESCFITEINHEIKQIYSSFASKNSVKIIA